MKKILKQITPPFIFTFFKNIFSKPILYNPIWNTLHYAPMENVNIFFDPKGPWQKKMMGGSYDSFLFERIKNLDPKNKVILDIGAHIGFHSLYFARLVGKNGRIYAFEPNPKNIERIKLNLSKNADLRPIISIFDLALSNTKGTEKFTLNENIESGRSSGGFIENSDTIWDKKAFKDRGFFEIDVKTISLDSLFNEGQIKEKPDILKIDVEGAESFVLEGAKETIKKHKPNILMEVHSMISMLKVITFLCSINYKTEILKVEDDGRCFIEAKTQL